MNRHISTFAALAVGLLLLTSCGSSGGVLGDILGGGTSNQSSNEIRGTVDRVDLNNKIIYLTNTYSSMLSSGGSGGSGSAVSVYFDTRTAVDYQGRTYRPEDLERGDEVAVRVTQSGNQLVADQVTVLRNVSSGTGTGTGTNTGSYDTNVRGTIRSIDTSRRTMTIDRGNGSSVTVDYDTNTPVTHNGGNYTPQDLERGDEVDIRVRDLGNGRMVADDVQVLRSVSGGTTNNSASTIRGTVRNHDTSRRTIELEQTSWLNNFNRSTGNSGTVTIQYPANISIEVSGQMQSISGLERGDVVDVQVRNANSTTPIADRIILVRDVNYR